MITKSWFPISVYIFAFWITSVLAQSTSYPNHPVKLILGYPPGGASDIVGRILAQELSIWNKQQFVVENKPGVGGMLGLSMVVKAVADGYTLGLASSGMLTTGPHLRITQLYDPLHDFTFISPIIKAPMVLLVGSSFPYNDVQTLIRAAKMRPGEIMYASGAQAFELAMQLFMSKTDVEMTSVPYTGGAAASIDVMAGRIPILIDTIGAQMQNIQSGKLRALAVLDSSRSPVLPEIPTMIEAGVTDYKAIGWASLVAPRGTPSAIINKLNQQIGNILAMPDIKQKLLAIGFEPWYSSPRTLEQTIVTEYATWGDVVREAGMVPQ